MCWNMLFDEPVCHFTLKLELLVYGTDLFFDELVFIFLSFVTGWWAR